MKLLYDISVLGIGHVHPKARTGIFRVIENVAEHLVSKKELDLMFCSGLDTDTIEQSIQYLKTNENLKPVPISVSNALLKNHHKKKRLELIKSLHGDPNIGLLSKLPRKIHIRTSMLREKMLSFGLTQENDFIKPKDLEKANIYHSSFYPINEQVRRSGLKAIFLTSYDIIPLLYPQYTEEAVVELIRNVVQSITPDTWVLCISEATRNDLLNYLGNRVDPNKVRVTELAASGTFYQSRNKEVNKEVKKKYGIPDAPYILSLCTLEPRKNIDQAIRAFVKLITQENIRDLNLVLVGAKGWMFDKIFDEIEASAAIRDRIIITGYVADEDLAPLYSDALLFVYPSFYEGFGLPPLEAMQCGTPVITSNTSSLPEVVGDAGIMVAPTDLEALCQAMLSIYKSPALRERMVQQSLERASKFSWERCVNETVDAYKVSLK